MMIFLLSMNGTKLVLRVKCFYMQAMIGNPKEIWLI